jgi:hypothetical protein
MKKKLVSFAAFCFSLATLSASPAHAALYSFSAHTFTSCGTSGRTGPAQATCRSAYSTTWDEADSNYTVTGGIQYWTVPVTGRYYIDAYGAGGAGTLAGGGARIADTFDLTEGEVIRILVGQTANITAGVSANGGGGGSFVVRSPFNTNGSILIVAGGGGGSESGSSQNTNAHASITTSGNDGVGTVSSTNSGAGGTNGSGGGTASADNAGGGGGGFLTDGIRNTNWDNNGGSAFINGGLGGGGGAAGKGSGGGAGGGGGYSGGGGSDNVTNGAGGGGGSYYANGLNINRIRTVDAFAENTNGSVTITLVGTASISLTAAGSATQITKGQVLLLTANAGLPGNVTFYSDGKRIPGCISIATAAGNVNCSWKASVQRPVSLTAKLVMNGALAATSTDLKVSVKKKSGLR